MVRNLSGAGSLQKFTRVFPGTIRSKSVQRFFRYPARSPKSGR